MKTIAKALFVIALLFLVGWVVMRPFADRSRRANSFAAHIKEGQTIEQVFAGPGEWNSLSVDCKPAGKPTDSVYISRREGNYFARPLDSAEKQYPDLAALVAELSAGTGPFAGRSAIRLTYKYYMATAVFVLTLGPDGRVTNVERLSYG